VGREMTRLAVLFERSGMILSCIWSGGGGVGVAISLSRSVQLPPIPVKAFSQTDSFKFEFTANLDPHKNLTDQSQSRT